MTKDEARKLLGGTNKKAAEALEFGSISAFTMWADPLPIHCSDRVRGAAIRLGKRIPEALKERAPKKNVA